MWEAIPEQFLYSSCILQFCQFIYCNSKPWSIRVKGYIFHKVVRKWWKCSWHEFDGEWDGRRIVSGMMKKGSSCIAIKRPSGGICCVRKPLVSWTCSHLEWNTSFFFSPYAGRHSVFGAFISGREGGREGTGDGGSSLPSVLPAIARYLCLLWVLFANVPSHQTLPLSPATDNSQMRGQSWNQSRLWIFFFKRLWVWWKL